MVEFKYTTLLQTKLFMPASGDVIARPNLLSQMNESLQKRLILISAPAGYGKTTLVSTWLTSLDKPVAWVSLDDADNDLEQFWRYTIVALEPLLPELAKSLKELELSSREATVQIINAFAHLPQDSYVVWDDYHLIREERVHESVQFFLENLPPKLHVIITCRSEPPLSLSKLRVRRQLLELSAKDLRFRQGEVASFFNEMMGLSLSIDQIDALETRTEGWVASLQLAALSMQGSADLTTTIRSFAGSQSHVFDYLLGEVLEQQDKDVQQFLLDTSVLERFNADLCTAVTKLENIAKLLERIQKAQLFLIPLDETRTWFRYHHLFAETLQKRLLQVQPEKLSDLHTLAADWFEREGFIDEAIRHVIAGSDMERAVELIETHARQFKWHKADNPTLQRWLGSLPDEVIRARPRLCLDRAWIEIGNPSTKSWIEDAERLLEQEAANDKAIKAMRGELALLQATVATTHADAEAVLKLSTEAMKALPKDSTLQGMAMQMRGYALRVKGNMPEAEAALLEAIIVSQQVHNQTAEILSLVDLAEVYQQQAKLSSDKETYFQAVDRASQGRKAAVPAACNAFLGLANMAREQNQLAQAKEYALKALELAQVVNFTILEFFIQICLAFICQAQQKEQAATEHMAIAESLISPQNTRRRALFEAEKALLALRQGRLAEAKDWAKNQTGLASTAEYEHERLILARVLLSEHRANEVLNFVDELTDQAEREGRVNTVIRAKLIKALCLDQMQHADEALTKFTEALSLAEPEAFIRLFVDEGEAVRPLLLRALAAGKHATYVSKLLTSFSDTNDQQGPTSTLLTKRELEILGLIAEGHSNGAIAEKLIRSIGTIKGHTNTIYSKLGVENRTQAVARARELKLLR